MKLNISKFHKKNVVAVLGERRARLNKTLRIDRRQASFLIYILFITEICTNEGDIRQQPTEGSNEIFIQYCSGGSWHYLCSGGVGWTPTLASVACRQLGYSDQGT